MEQYFFKKPTHSTAVSKNGRIASSFPPSLSINHLISLASRDLRLYYSTLYPKSDLCIPINEIVQTCSKFLPLCIIERFIYSQDLAAHLAAAKKQTDSGNT
jgi:hypothetical protein